MTAPFDHDTERDTERDARLQVALRHAPDAKAAPPVALSDAILRAAHGAVAQAGRAAPAPSGWLRQLSAAWAWLGQPRLAGALAGLMVATLVGVLWWDQPIQRALDPAGEAPLRSSDSSAAPAVATAPGEPAVAKPKLAKPVQEIEAKARAVAAPRAAAEPAPAPSPAISPEPATARAPAPAAAPAIARGPAPTRSEVSAEAPMAGGAETRQAAAVIAKTALKQDAAAAGIASPPAPATPALGSAARRADAAVRERAELSSATAAAPVPALNQALNKSAAPAAAAAPASLADVRAAIAAQPDRWTWQLGAQPPRAMTAELQAWLARLDAAAGTALGGPVPPESSAAQSESATLHLLRDARAHCSIHWGTEAVQLVSAGGAQAHRRAGLPPQTSRELAAELAQIAAR
ncbi:MAG: hypothetical protein ABL900_12410 [Burkholderiaceae bacterium]